MEAIDAGRREKAMDLIRKLLATARDGRGNEHEAASAAAKAEKLMRAYQIESVDEITKEVEDDASFARELEQVSFEGIKGHCPKQVPAWVGFIAIGCGRAFTCKVDIVSTPEGVKVRFSGFSLDVMLCRWVYKFLCDEVMRISKDRMKGQGMSAAKSFRIGCASVLQQRLQELKKDREQDVAAGSTALVLYGRKEQRVQEMYGDQKTKAHSGSVGDRSAWAAGREAGKQINIPSNRPLTGTTQQRLN